MFDIIKQIINHEYITNATGDQQIIYYICGVLIIIFSVTFIDMIYRLLRSICKKGDF